MAHCSNWLNGEPTTGATTSSNPPTQYLTEENLAWLNQLKNLWGIWKSGDGIEKMLLDYFEASINPFSDVLLILKYCKDLKDGSKGNTLPCIVMEEFTIWVVHQDPKPQPSPDDKYEAFQLISQHRNPVLVKLVSSLFHLLDDKLLFVSYIKDMLSEHLYRDVCQTVSVLKLHSFFEVEEFVVPLILQDKFGVASDFLKDSVRHQRETTLFFDNLLGKRSPFNEIESFIRSNKIPDTHCEKLYGKSLAKFVSRLCKTYNLHIDFCPNLSSRRKVGALQFLVHKRYVDHGFSKESWREMVLEAVGIDKELQQEIVHLVNNAGDPEEALHWATTFNLPIQAQPYNVKHLARGLHRDAVAPAVEEDWDNAPEVSMYHTLSLPESAVEVIDSPASFRHLLQVFKTTKIVGIDSEWKPAFGTTISTLALIQIAADNRVYIVDVATMGTVHAPMWEDFNTTLFENIDILKLGFNLNTDKSMFTLSLPYLENVTFSGPGFLDLDVLWKKLIIEHHFAFPYHDEESSGGRSLSHLVQWSVGKPLDKSEQFSNWERRPLRNSQKIYAALDAYCLLEVYKVMEACSKTQCIPFDEVCLEVMYNAKAHKRMSKRSCVSRVPPDSPSAVEPPSQIPARNMKVVCDSMLGGLGKQLRMCGIDAVIIETSADEPNLIINIANQEGRIILTQGHNYSWLQQHVPKGKCYNILQNTSAEQLRETIHYFNIVVTKDDVFSRCKLCNCGDLRIIPNAEMMKLQQLKEDPFNNLCYTSRGVLIKCSCIAKQVIKRVSIFRVCEHCGKVYWDGSHLYRTLESTLRDIISS